MNPKKLATVILEELKAIHTVGMDERDRERNKNEFEARFAEWVIAHTPDKRKLCLLTDDQVTDETGLIQALRSDSSSDQQKLILQQFPKDLQERIRRTRGNKDLTEKVIETLNLLLDQGDLPKLLQGQLPANEEKQPGTAQARMQSFDSVHDQILAKLDGKLPQRVVNRLWLQAIFPKSIGRCWAQLPLVYQWIHRNRQVEHNALCLSGGGIRSATFGLGLLQGLSKHGLLPKFQYLSTVSGGGYIGGWLTAWISRQGFDQVSGALGNNHAAKDPLAPEPEELSHLREYSNYLTPKLGATSADTWTLVATYCRNLFLNWSVFLPALALVLIIPRLCLAICLYPVMDWFGIMALITGFIGTVWALVYAAFHRPSMRVPLAADAGQSRFLCLCLAPLYVAATGLTSAWAWLQRSDLTFGDFIFNHPSNTNSAVPILPFVLFGVGVHLVAWLLYSLAFKIFGTGGPSRTATTARINEGLACLLSGSVGGLLLWVGGWLTHKGFEFAPSTELFVCFGAPWFLGSFLVSLFLFAGLTSHLTTDEDREWWARMAAWCLIALGAWCAFSVLVLFGPTWLLKLPRVLAGVGGITGVVTLILSYGTGTPANRNEAGTETRKATPGDIVLAAAAPVFVACLVAGLSLGTTYVVKKVSHWSVLPHEANALPVLDNGTLLSAGDITDFASIAAKLKVNSDEVAAKLWQGFDAGLKQQLSDYVATGSRANETLASLTRGLNRVVKGESIFEPGLFHDKLLREEQLEQLSERAKGQKRRQFNRLLLQDAFPGELAQSDFNHEMITHQTLLRVLFPITGGLLASSLLLSLWININRFSLHAIYRNRLIRAYLGASNRKRQPNRFTGFDPNDNLFMSELKSKPFHIVNMALNLVSGEKLAWQQRKAESFTASPLHAGSLRLGYRDVEDYAAGKVQKRTSLTKSELDSGSGRDRGLKLGTAITISGAAASPNMGYHSSPVLAFIMTLFNVRLGAWLGNPGRREGESYRDPAPKLAFVHLVKEALGFTDDKARYIYLSDGGHFENLGLYEMVLRRCRYIVVSDAGCDPECALEDLGNAIRKIRIDLGIPIEIDRFDIRSRKYPESKYCAVGKIYYGEVDGKGRADEAVPPGTLIYIKPAIAGDEPKDVFNYKEKSSSFPHEPTSDQWFSESQFESYRILSAHIVETICRGTDGEWNPQESDDLLEHFCQQAEAYLNGISGQFTRNVIALSPTFCRYYNNGLTAEGRRLWQECGEHYRKAIEALIKDFLVRYRFNSDTSRQKEIEGLDLKEVVERFVEEQRIRKFVQEALWVGNGGKLQSWGPKEIEELKRLIGIAANYIDVLIEARKYLN